MVGRGGVGGGGWGGGGGRGGGGVYQVRRLVIMRDESINY